MSKQTRRPTGIIYGNHVWPAVAGYEMVSSYYDEWYWQIFWKANELPLIVQELKRFSSSTTQALDVGTGTGLYLAELLRLNIQCVGLDVSQKMLNEARKTLPSSARLICGTVEKIPFPDETLSLIIACRVLSHVADLSVTISEIGRVTKVGGRLIISDVSSEHNYTTTRIPTPDGDVHIETYKHTVDQLATEAKESGYWRIDFIKSVTYKDLLWKPQPSKYPAIDISSARPIFFYGVFTRLKKG